MAIPDDQLEKLMDDADLGSRARKKLREANKQQTAEAAPSPSRSRGHGAPAPTSREIGKI